MENWKSIVGYEGLYEVSNTGLVRSLNYNHTGMAKLLKPRNNRGYLVVVLCKDGIHKHMFVHRLVAEAFIPNPNKLETINHKDEDKTNNAAGNLEWLSWMDNSNYGTRNKRIAEANVNNLKLSKQVQMFDKSGNVVKQFPSTQEAARQTGIAQSSIVTCCKGRIKSAGGYVWRYA